MERGADAQQQQQPAICGDNGLGGTVTSWPSAGSEPSLLQELNALLRKAEQIAAQGQLKSPRTCLSPRSERSEGGSAGSAQPQEPPVCAPLPVYLQVLQLLSQRFPVYASVFDRVGTFFASFAQSVCKWYELSGPGKLRAERARAQSELSERYRAGLASVEQGVERLYAALAQQQRWNHEQRQGMAADVADKQRTVAALHEAALQESDQLRQSRARSNELREQMVYLQSEVRLLIQKDRDAARLGVANQSLAEENFALSKENESQRARFRAQRAMLEVVIERQRAELHAKTILCAALRQRNKRIKQQIGELRDRMRQGYGRQGSPVPARTPRRDFVTPVGMLDNGAASVGPDGQGAAARMVSPVLEAMLSGENPNAPQGYAAEYRGSHDSVDTDGTVPPEAQLPQAVRAPEPQRVRVKLPPEGTKLGVRDSSDPQVLVDRLVAVALSFQKGVRTAQEELTGLRMVTAALDQKLLYKASQEMEVPPPTLRTFGDSLEVPAFLRTPLPEVRNLCFTQEEARAEAWQVIAALPGLNMAAAIGIDDDKEQEDEGGGKGGDGLLHAWDPAVPIGKMMMLYLRDKYGGYRPEDVQQQLTERSWTLYWACEAYADCEPACRFLSHCISGRIPAACGELVHGVVQTVRELLPSGPKAPKKQLFAAMDHVLKGRPTIDLLRCRQAVQASGALVGNMCNIPVLLGDVARPHRKARAVAGRPGQSDDDSGNDSPRSKRAGHVVSHAAAPTFVRFLQELCVDAFVEYYDAAGEAVRRCALRSRRDERLLICRVEDLIDEMSLITYPLRPKGPGGAAAMATLRASKVHRRAGDAPMMRAFDVERFVGDTARLIEPVDGEYHTARPCAQEDVWLGAEDFLFAFRSVPMYGFADPLLRRRYNTGAQPSIMSPVAGGRASPQGLQRAGSSVHALPRVGSHMPQSALQRVGSSMPSSQAALSRPSSHLSPAQGTPRLTVS